MTTYALFSTETEKVVLPTVDNIPAAALNQFVKDFPWLEVRPVETTPVGAGLSNAGYRDLDAYPSQ